MIHAHLINSQAGSPRLADGNKSSSYKTDLSALPLLLDGVRPWVFRVCLSQLYEKVVGDEGLGPPVGAM